MTRYILFCIAVMLSGCTTSNDITMESIPVTQIRNCLPKEWRIESVMPVNTVSGWTKLNGSSGVRITISRTPYDMTLHRTKSGELAVSIPRLYMYVFPSDFEGKHVNTSAVFRKGKITNMDKIIFTKDGSYQAEVSGDITIHGVTKNITTTGTIIVSRGKIIATSKFILLPQDFDIEIPAVVEDKIAKEIEVNVDITFIPN